MRINHNIASLNTYRMLNTNATNGNKALEKLSSGLRINRAGDDAAGLAISEKMRAQVRGLDRAAANAQDGISLIQTAEGGLNEVHSILQRIRELADQAANGTNTADDRNAIQDEVTQLKAEIDRIGNTTEFNTQKLLNGALKGAVGASVGANSTIGGIVGKLAPAQMTSATSVKADHSAATFGIDTITVDGVAIEVNWDTLLSKDDQNLIKSNLSTAADVTLTKVRETLTNAINAAIDASGKNVAHISSFLTAGNNIVLQSGTSGTKSEVTVSGVAAATSVAATFLSGNAGAVSTANYGTDTYNGSDVATGATFDLVVNGTLLGLVTTSGDILNGDDMTAAAAQLATDINTIIGNYNTATGKASGEEGFIENVTISVTDDGRFNINSQSGPVELKDLAGQTYVSDLGLSEAQTEAAGNGGMTFQIGANRGQTITFGLNDMRTAALGIAGISVSTATSASSALVAIDSAIKTVSSERSKIGAVQNRLEHTINNLNTSAENLTAAESRIRDVDMAKEMMEFTKNNILSQAAQAMLAQANQQPQGVLQLLR